MDLVKKIPIDKILNGQELIQALRIRHLSSDDIEKLLIGNEVSFVVAEINEPLSWIAEEDKLSFWKSEARDRIVYPDDEIILDDYPDSYCYAASEWSPYDKGVLILLEKYS